MFYIGLYREQHEKIFLSETTRLRSLIFDSILWTSTKFVQIISLGPKMASRWGQMFYTDLYRGKHEKIFFSETTRLRALIFDI